MKYLFILITLLSALFATIINIPNDLETIQQGIDASVDGDTVLVQPGTYIENINFIGKAIMVVSLYFVEQDTSYITSTIIDGNQNGSVVTFNSDEGPGSILQGFTITNGYSQSGGGLLISHASPTIDALKILQNSSIESGGGIYSLFSQFTVTNTLVQGNSSNSGGGIYFQASSPTFTNLVVIENIASSTGGGAHGFGSNGTIFPSLSTVEIINNQAGSAGGGIYFHTAVQATMNNLTITGNNSQNLGGGIYSAFSQSSLSNSLVQGNTSNAGAGIYFHSSSPTFTDLILTENIAVETGGGLHGNGINGTAYPTLVNVEITNNQSGGSGGGLYFHSNVQATMNNLTITGNNSQNLGGGIFGYGSTIKVINSIINENLGQNIYLFPNSCSLLIAFTDLQNGLSGIGGNSQNQIYWLDGNIDQAPLFMYPDTSNYSLQYSSPCIDAGTTLVVFEDDTLYQAVPGSYNGFAPDMGAYEFNINDFYLAGDVNGDFQLDVLDAVILVQIILGEVNPSEYQTWAADTNQDFNIDVLDAVILVNLILSQ